MNGELELMEHRSKETTLGRGYCECRFMEVLRYRCFAIYDGAMS